MIMAPNGDWLFSYNYEYLGKYPASLFKVLNQGACRAHVYAEVYNPHPELGWVRTEMGSGQFPNAPDGHVAWVRQIRYFDLNTWLPMEPPTDDMGYWSKPYDTTCYARNPLINQGAAGPLMLFGEPGGYRPECAAIKLYP
ncbi:MAG TPA: neprosin family prolyl endopeptidase [Polyangium sp.]|nr:neprosin family prolyl endopeptidase [Polyangium sp.]